MFFPPENKPASDTGLMHPMPRSGYYHAGTNRTVTPDFVP
jgi:hypothetical protein